MNQKTTYTIKEILDALPDSNTLEERLETLRYEINLVKQVKAFVDQLEAIQD